ncbi:MAG: DNRLRE domain-containing protein [Bacteroidales bacterium]|nr:DNRLRE domain-containing protein [Bacteroidales bacterium]
MKNPGRLFVSVLVISSVVLLSSCNKKNSPESNGTGMAEFSFTLNNPAGDVKSGTADSGMTSYQLMVSIEDLNGIPVLTDEMIPVYAFGTGFMSEKIEIKAGEYNLTKFIVIDPAGQVIFASPLEGSPLAYITNDPLPVTFSVIPGTVTSVVPEVLVVGNYTPADFGYANFGVQVIKPLEFYAVCYLYNPLIMAPTTLTDARLTVYSNDGWYYSFDLKPEVNHLIIRGGSDFYTFVIEKEGYVSQTYQFSALELVNATKESPLGLKIPWGQQYNVLELQPGPEEGKDAMITNLQPDWNFGDYKYFETTFLTEPVLTVMRSNRSLISFDLGALPKSAIIQKVTLRLAFDLPIPFDSTFMNTDPSTGVAFYGAVLQQIIEPWDEHKVTWNNQPATIEMNQVYLYPFIRNSNITALDVTGLYVNPSAPCCLRTTGCFFAYGRRMSFPGSGLLRVIMRNRL